MLHSSEIIFYSFNIIFTEIITGLDLDKGQVICSGVHDTV
jgi:hypothetical protein